MRSRKLFVVPLGAIAVLLTFVSVAWACTVIQGSTNVAVPSTNTTCSSDTVGACNASPGASITVNATGAISGHTYYVHFLNFRNLRDGHGCMGLLGDPPGTPYGEERISNQGKTVGSGGTISDTAATIPGEARATNAATGPALVCFLSGDVGGPDYLVGTEAAQVTIL